MSVSQAEKDEPTPEEVLRQIPDGEYLIPLRSALNKIGSHVSGSQFPLIEEDLEDLPSIQKEEINEVIFSIIDEFSRRVFKLSFDDLTPAERDDVGRIISEVLDHRGSNLW